MKEQFNHPATNLVDNKKVVFTALSKKNFFWHKHIVKWVLDEGYVPISQYMNFDYFLLDTVPRDIIREANNNLIRRTDELWVFGDISDGVQAEIELVKKWGKPIRYFDISKMPQEIKEVSEKDAKFEDGFKV